MSPDLAPQIPSTDDLDLDVVLSVLREWQEANRAAAEIQALLPADALSRLERVGVQSPDEIRARWVSVVAALHPSVVTGYAGLLDYVVDVVEALLDGAEPPTPTPVNDATRIRELEERVAELETMIAGAAAVLRAAEVD